VVFEAEPEEANIMDRPPRKRGERLFARRTVLYSLLQGFGVLGIVFAVFCFSLLRGQGELEARAMAFTTMIFANLGLILTNRSWSNTIIGMLRAKNTALWAVISGSVLFLGLTLSVQPLRDLFHFNILPAPNVALCLAGGVISIAWFEVVKIVNRRRKVVI
jgi:Ca2+-transporting ATPase